MKKYAILTFEEWCKETFSEEFLKKAEKEYRKAEKEAKTARMLEEGLRDVREGRIRRVTLEELVGEKLHKELDTLEENE